MEKTCLGTIYKWSLKGQKSWLRREKVALYNTEHLSKAWYGRKELTWAPGMTENSGGKDPGNITMYVDTTCSLGRS